MTRYLVPFCSAVLVAASLGTDVHAQSAAAKVHVDAARAAVAPSVANRNRPYETFKALFDQVCTEPKLPDQMRTNDRSAIVPRKEWFTWPVEIFDNLHFIGTKTAGVWAISSSSERQPSVASISSTSAGDEPRWRRGKVSRGANKPYFPSLV